MAKLPGVADLGATPVAAAARPVASYDVSAMARGGAALAEGGRQLGAGIAKAGEGIADYATAESRWDYAKAHSDFVTRKMDLDEATRTDGNYGPDENGKALPQRYQEKITNLQSQAAALIQSAPMRDRFMLDTRPVAEQGFIAAQQHARTQENDASLAYVTSQGNAIMDRAVKAPDDASRRMLIDSHNQLVDGLLAKNAITEVQAVAMKQAWAHQYATADVLARADSDPQGVINELRAKPGSPDQVVSRIAQIEGTTRNSRSSATGTGQFIDSTWLDVLKRNRPDLAQGKTDAELLDLRADKQLGLQMTAAYAKENSEGLARQGLPVTPGNTYLAHFLGPAGAAAVLKGDPDKPVIDVLAKALGPDKAKAMVDANPKVLGGQLTGSIRQWADAKMGGAEAGQGSIYDMLRPDVREQVLSQAMAKQHAQVTDDLASFKAKVDDTTSEAMRTGNVAAPLQKTDFIRTLGAEVGPKQYAAYTANIQLGKDIQAVSGLDAAQQQALVASYAPKPGEGFADAAARQDALKKAIGVATSARANDPAFKARIENTVAEASRNGNVADPIKEEDFAFHFGPDAGPKAYAYYSASLRLGHAVQHVGELTPEEQGALLQSYAPKPGEDYTAQAQRQDTIAKAVKASNAERDKDPAAFAIARLPVVQDAYQKFSAVLGDVTADDESRRGAARDYASKILMEQRRGAGGARGIAERVCRDLKAKLDNPQEAAAPPTSSSSSRTKRGCGATTGRGLSPDRARSRPAGSGDRLRSVRQPRRGSSPSSRRRSFRHPQGREHREIQPGQEGRADRVHAVHQVDGRQRGRHRRCSTISAPRARSCRPITSCRA
jgi:hypothetical protein